MPLADVVKMASFIPACAIGKENTLGNLEPENMLMLSS